MKEKNFFFQKSYFKADIKTSNRRKIESFGERGAGGGGEEDIYILVLFLHAHLCFFLLQKFCINELGRKDIKTASLRSE